MVMKPPFDEVTRLPALHPRGCDCDPVDSTQPIGNVTADLAKTIAPENLKRARDGLLSLKAIGDRVVARLGVSSSRNPQSRIFSKLLYQEFKVIRFQGNVCIQVCHEVKLKRLDAFRGQR